MSALIPSEQQGRSRSEGLSKRELMKLEKAIKMFESQENQQGRHPKRRAHSSIASIEPAQRKQIKIDPHHATIPHDQILSSPLNSSEPLSTSPAQPQPAIKPLPHHLNPLYPLPEGDGSIFNYLLCYTYAEGEKKLEKECQDWASIDQNHLPTLSLVNCNQSAALCQRIQQRINEVKDRLKEPFGKMHRELNQRFLKKETQLQ